MPIGDWTINPYGPYIGCMDGSAEYVDKILDWAAAYNISVLLDVHTARGSQNGYDNGGRDWHVYWYKNESLGDGYIEFNHWDNLALDWLWDWDHHLNFAHMKWSVDQMEGILQRWGSHSALIGLEPVNEPNYWTDQTFLKAYYREVRKMVRQYAPQAYFVFHNSFRPDWSDWEDLFAPGDREMTAVDHHGYFAWSNYQTVEDACAFIEGSSDFANDFRANGVEVWWGEWALATDNCAMWLGGFND